MDDFVDFIEGDSDSLRRWRSGEHPTQDVGQRLKDGIEFAKARDYPWRESLYDDIVSIDTTHNAPSL